VLVWITEGGWEAAVDAAATLDAGELTLLYVTSVDLPGPRGRRHEQVVARMHGLAEEAAEALLEDAEERLGREAHRVVADGEPEAIVFDAAAECDVLVVARDGRHPGPHSIGHRQRWVIDHAPCTVVLAWPEGAPDDDHPPPKPKPKPKPKPHP
jgi:nucleotide-binding universal stress UspA family protein